MVVVVVVVMVVVGGGDGGGGGGGGGGVCGGGDGCGGGVLDLTNGLVGTRRFWRVHSSLPVNCDLANTSRLFYA